MKNRSRLSVLPATVLGLASLVLGASAPWAGSVPLGANVTLSLMTPMPAGALFVEWSDAGGERDLAAQAFLAHAEAEPIVLRFDAPATEGELRIYLMNKNGRQLRHFCMRDTFAAGSAPVLDAVDKDYRFNVTVRP